MLDPWKDLRSTLWANNEPAVELIGLTVPGCLDEDRSDNHFFKADGLHFYPTHLETQVTQAAAVSTGAIIKDRFSLLKSLIRLGHHTPLEAIQFNFHISGISKACGAQLSRHRIGQGHVSSSRRYQVQGAAFVYPVLDYITDQNAAQQLYCFYQDAYKESYYNYLTVRKAGAKKDDSRYLIPAATATERIWWSNARALRDFLRLRLHPSAEAEIRRLSLIILDVASKLTPTVFHDFEALQEG